MPPSVSWVPSNLLTPTTLYESSNFRVVSWSEGSCCDFGKHIHVPEEREIVGILVETRERGNTVDYLPMISDKSFLGKEKAGDQIDGKKRCVPA